MRPRIRWTSPSTPSTLRDEFTQSIADQRMMAMLVGLFGGLAVLLAAVGLYGTLSHMTSQRIPEIGLRLALGARPLSILHMVIGHGVRLAAAGTVIGLGGAFLAVRLVRNQLFGVQPSDPLTFIAVCAVLFLVTILACLIPARRAMRVDPVVAIRGM